jgi:two-component sensor histidine kinase
MTPVETPQPKGRILIIDDEPASLKILTDLLAEQGYAVHPANQGELGLHFVQCTPPDLILLDIRMSGMDGYQVCASLRNNPATAGIPVIFLSSLDRALDKVKAFRSGGVDYIVKPYEAEEVLARVETHLSLRRFRQSLESEVRDRTAQLRDSLREKEALLKEVHHRVKNNLQLITSLLSLQASRIKDPAAKEWFAESQNRVRTMALVHENLYQTGNFVGISMARHLSRVCHHLCGAHGLDDRRIQVITCIADVYLDIDRAVPCGLIVNELVSNALKHAFPNSRTGQVRVQLERLAAGQTVLVVADNGVGLPPHLDTGGANSLGLQLVDDLTHQLHGTISISRDRGTTFTITFNAESGGEQKP